MKNCDTKAQQKCNYTAKQSKKSDKTVSVSRCEGDEMHDRLMHLTLPEIDNMNVMQLQEFTDKYGIKLYSKKIRADIITLIKDCIVKHRDSFKL